MLLKQIAVKKNWIKEQYFDDKGIKLKRFSQFVLFFTYVEMLFLRSIFFWKLPQYIENMSRKWKHFTNIIQVIPGIGITITERNAIVIITECLIQIMDMIKNSSNSNERARPLSQARN